jgi:hypothetical protein
MIGDYNIWLYSLDYNFLNPMPEQKKSFLNKTVFIFSGAIGIFLCFLTLLIQYLVLPNIVFEGKEKIKVEITPVSATVISQKKDSGKNIQTNETNTPSIPGVFALGMIIKVNGTDNEGLRIHSDAGIDQPTLFLAKEGEQFNILEGPIIKDSLIWWKIKSLNDSTKTGWAVQDYMKAN